MEVINSLSAENFDVTAEINSHSGRLSSFVDTSQREKLPAAQIIQRVAIESFDQSEALAGVDRAAVGMGDRDDP